MTTALLTTLTKTKALEILEAAVARNGADFRYRSHFGPDMACQYTVRKTAEHAVCACLIGVALNELGVPVDHIELHISTSLPSMAGWEADPDRFDEHDPPAFVHAPFFDEAEAELCSVGYEATDAATRVLWAAQVRQDLNDTWGEALSFARLVAADLVEE